MNHISKPLAKKSIHAAIKHLIIAISAISINQTTQADTLAKQIGDLEIYQQANSGKSTLSPLGIIVPDDPYNNSAKLSYAYLSYLLPITDKSSSIWMGNVKKYELNEGTLLGKSTKQLFSDTNGTIDATVEDVWSASPASDNTAVNAGGIYAKLIAPLADNIDSVRTVYVEDDNRTLRKIGVKNGKFTVDDKPYSVDSFTNKTLYDKKNVIRLINFLGFNGIDGQDPTTLTLTKDNVTATTKVLGASLHASPASISYSAKINQQTGQIEQEGREDYLLFGSQDGALHVVDAATGEEQYAIIPKKMMTTQPTALVAGSDKDKDDNQLPIGVPYFGIDAPWMISAKYQPNASLSKMESTGDIIAYGGFRMGGDGMMSIKLNKQAKPEILFNLDTTTGFERMGQIWNKPVKARMKTKSSDKDGKDVLIFGGGYDMCYEYQDFQVGATPPTQAEEDADKAKAPNLQLGIHKWRAECETKAKTQTMGNALYIIDALTGEKLWSATYKADASEKLDGQKYMTNSIVAEPTVLDRDNDGLIDNIYFADLGGQVFRIDFQNGLGSSTRLTRILTSSKEKSKFAFRFYERPIVSFYRNTRQTINNVTVGDDKLFAVVNVISGDRSSPLSKIRQELTDSDRVYGVIDSDITKQNAELHGDSFTPAIKDLTDDNLLSYPTALGSTTSGYSKEQKLIPMIDLKSHTKKGWYYPLIRFDGWTNVNFNKGVGRSQVIAGDLYTSVYNPNMSYQAEIKGGTERELYCLPFGICMDDSSKSGTGGYTRAGVGIQELILAPRGKDKPNELLLIGYRNIAQAKNDANASVGYGDDSNKSNSPIGIQDPLANGKPVQSAAGSADGGLGDGSKGLPLYRYNFKLIPSTWYELTK